MAIPRIAITTGEPAGIGPDIVLMAAQQSWDAELVVIADPDLLQQRAQLLKLPLSLHTFSPGSPARPPRAGSLIIQPVLMAAPVIPGTLDPANANYVMETLRAAVYGCTHNTYQALVTGPVQKSVINDAGIPFVGHTEFLADETETSRVVMMLATRDLRVALATTHLALKDVPDSITRELLQQTLGILHTDLRTKFRIDRPRIAVLGLNPHAGQFYF